MYTKLLKDLGVDQEILNQETPSRVLRKLLKAFIDSSIDSDELKNFILDYARKNDLVFLCPKEWLTSQEQLNKAEEVDHEKFLFTIKSEGLTAEFIRSLIQALKDVKEANADLVVSLASSGQDLPEKIVLSEKSSKDIFETEENYLTEDIIEESEKEEDEKSVKETEEKQQKEDDMEKANELEVLNIQVIANDLILEMLMEAMNKSSVVTLDPDETAQKFNVENVFVDSFVISEPDDRGIKTLRIEGSNLQTLADVLTSLGERGNEGYSFPVLTDGEYLMDWDGDVTDYVVDVQLNKAVSTVPFNLPLANNGLNREQAELQEMLASLGVLLELVYIKDRRFYNVYVDISSDTSKIQEVFASNGYSLISEVATSYYKVLTFTLVEEIPVVSDDVLSEISLSLTKAKKGTPQYEEWLEKYHAKKGSKSDIMTKEDLGKVLESNSVKEMMEMWKFRERRQQAEEELERMFQRRKRK